MHCRLCSQAYHATPGMESASANAAGKFSRTIASGGALLVPNPKLRLREQLREVMRFKHYSVRTEENYWHWIRHFILFHGKKHPARDG